MVHGTMESGGESDSLKLFVLCVSKGKGENDGWEVMCFAVNLKSILRWDWRKLLLRKFSWYFYLCSFVTSKPVSHFANYQLTLGETARTAGSYNGDCNQRHDEKAPTLIQGKVSNPFASAENSVTMCETLQHRTDQGKARQIGILHIENFQIFDIGFPHG